MVGWYKLWWSVERMKKYRKEGKNEYRKKKKMKDGGK